MRSPARRPCSRLHLSLLALALYAMGAAAAEQDGGGGGGATSADPAGAPKPSGAPAPAAVTTSDGAPEQARPVFREAWGYLLRGEEKQLLGTEPITDIAYVGAYLNRTGRIAGTVARPTLVTAVGNAPRVHLVVAETSNMALLHFALDARYGVRPLLVEDIRRVARGFDGVQIDFEGMARDDAAAFHEFLRDLRAALPPATVLSIAVPARTSTVADPYEYPRIQALVDRVIVMAYDQHWSGGEAGPVASATWAAKVADYARTVVPAAKLVMGLPLYGRAWQDRQHARALRFDRVQELLAETGSTPAWSDDRGASFTYTLPVTVTVFYEDVRSLAGKLALYRARGVEAVSFWRIGQGPPEAWGTFAVEAVVPAPIPPTSPATPSSGAPPTTAPPTFP